MAPTPYKIRRNQTLRLHFVCADGITVQLILHNCIKYMSLRVHTGKQGVAADQPFLLSFRQAGLLCSASGPHDAKAI